VLANLGLPGEPQVRVVVDFVELGILIERRRAHREPAFQGYDGP
jgi:hypothetical protein